MVPAHSPLNLGCPEGRSTSPPPPQKISLNATARTQSRPGFLRCPVVPLFPFLGGLGSLFNPFKQIRAPFLSLGSWAAQVPFFQGLGSLRSPFSPHYPFKDPFFIPGLLLGIATRMPSSAHISQPPGYWATQVSRCLEGEETSPPRCMSGDFSV